MIEIRSHCLSATSTAPNLDAFFHFRLRCLENSTIFELSKMLVLPQIVSMSDMICSIVKTEWLNPFRGI